MRRALSPLLSLLVLALFCASVRADVLSNGLDTGRSSSVQPPQHPASGCRVLWYGIDTGSEVARLTALGFDATRAAGPGDLTAANLASYDVLVVAYTGAGVIGAARPVIAAFVSGGGGLLVHQPNAVAVLDYVPDGCEVTILSEYWCNYQDFAYAHIVNGGHVVTAGLSDADLSGAYDFVGPLGPAYSVLAVSLICQDPALAVARYGNGRVAFEDGNSSPGAVDPGSDTYWVQLYRWLCTSGTVPAERSTWGEMKARYR